MHRENTDARRKGHSTLIPLKLTRQTVQVTSELKLIHGHINKNSQQSAYVPHKFQTNG